MIIVGLTFFALTIGLPKLFSKGKETIEKREVVVVAEKGQARLGIAKIKYLTAKEIAEESENISSVTRITNNDSKGEIDYPSLSPDGKNIAFQFWQPGTKAYNIWSISSSGGGGMKKITSSVYFDIHPVWAPNGKNIVFSSNRTGQLKLWKVKSTGMGGIMQLTSGNTSDMYPDTSSDGEKIVFSTRSIEGRWREIGEFHPHPVPCPAYWIIGVTKRHNRFMVRLETLRMRFAMDGILYLIFSIS